MNPDSDIFKLLESDQNRGFSLLVERYGQKLYWHIRRIVLLHDDADDTLQNTFVSVWKNLPAFRSESSLYTWLYRIATNEALTTIGRRKKESSVSIDDLGSVFDSSKEGDSWFDGDEAQARLQNAILKLPEKQRVVFNLKYFEEMQYDEMSKVLNTSAGALKASYHHAVKKIEDYLLNG
ncbi:MAG TPA: sigma-70 family RNA polymerase sigma factor [Bacteroidales bacterium]|nr:sigma-70 family RNA polymerase sigma factor [Bacteroidales bacterium]